MGEISTPSVEQILFKDGENSICRFIRESHNFKDCGLVSTTPFIIKTDVGNLFITNKETDEIPSDCEYGLLNSRKPNKSQFKDNNWKFQRWLKHPHMNEITSEDIRDSWKNQFSFKKEDSSNGQLGLRSPQIGAIYSILAHDQNADDFGIVVLPTGTGKTETMISTMIANQCSKVLVSVPSISLRGQISESFKKLGILRKIGVVPENILNPIVGVIRTKFKTLKEYHEFTSRCNVVVTTMQILAGLPTAIAQKVTEDFSHYFVDEAHHSEAPSWRKFIDGFPKGKVFLFTATPYRNDNKKLNGKIIFNFSLRKAQEQGYYKKINFVPVREYDKEDADRLIANAAVEQLKSDISEGFQHILMARCKSKIRAEEIFHHYKYYSEFNPVVVYTGKSGLNQIISNIKKKEHRIIVCVDMLGEGFDLPELKIAAIHDERQSIPVMLQFIGRFTRTSNTKLGNATFITNTAYPPIKEELNNLYNLGSDWNVLLPKFSDGITHSQIEFNEMLEGFQNVKESQIPFHSINPAMSAVVYRNNGTTWSPQNWKSGLPGLGNFEHQFSDTNESEKVLVIILGKKSNVDWVNFEETQNLSWDLITIHWDYRPRDRNLIFVHTSFKNLAAEQLLKAIFGKNIVQFEGEEVFRVLDGLKRYTIHNFGGRKGIGRDISFQSFFGKNVADGLHQLDQKKLEKNNVFGAGYSAGKLTSMGCSRKGKIWSYLRGNLKDLIHWCQYIGTKLLDDSIDTDTILSHTIKSRPITSRPEGKVPIYVDWNPEMYSFSEGKYVFTILDTGKSVDISECELKVVENGPNDNLSFTWESEFGISRFELVLGQFIDEGGTERATYEYVLVEGSSITVSSGSRQVSLKEFFRDLSPVIYFHDTSYLYKFSYREPKDPISEYDTSDLREMDWSGVNTANESMGFDTLDEESIQFNFVKFIENNYDLIYNDDNKGEMADIVAIKAGEDSIKIDLFHLKFAKGGKPSSRIDNFYELCGQAQKSINWKHCERSRLFDHLFRRLKNKKRIVKGDIQQLEEIRTKALWNMDVSFGISIVQPGLSKATLTNDIKSLIANTSYFLKATGDVDLGVYISK